MCKLTRWVERTLRLLEPDPLGCHCQTGWKFAEAQVVLAHWGLPRWQFAAQMARQMQGRGPRHLRMRLAGSRRSLFGREELAKEPLRWLRSW